MNRPCSTTPGMSASRWASDVGSGMRASAASRMRCPPSVTKTWPSRVWRGSADPGHPHARGGRLDGTPRRREPERHHLDRQRKAAERRNEFALVGDDDHAGGGRRHDLLAQERAAAALDEAEVGRDLVGAVDREVELGRLVERRQRHARAFGVGARRLRGRHADDVEPAAHALAEQRHEMLRGRAGAEPEPHAGAHEFDRTGGGGMLEFFGSGYGHRGQMGFGSGDGACVALFRACFLAHFRVESERVPSATALWPSRACQTAARPIATHA